VSVFDAMILAVIQGFAEFLPISSSGHLVFAQELLNIHNPEIVSFDVFIHFGTLISVVIFFFKDIIEILRSFFKACITFHIKEEYVRTEYFRLGIAIVLGSIPAGVIGFLFHRQIEEIFIDPKFAAMNIVITGLILFLTRLAKPTEGKKVSIFSSIIIGLGQAIAILPGISRSGLTMSIALFLKISPVQAARFSFLLSIPVIIGAAMFEAAKMIEHGTTIGSLPIVVGIVLSALTGYVAIKLLLHIMEKGKFSLFSLYCLGIGILGIIYI
jgi:undecaprenyl-diphosphatase